jgi:hypothetical protein
MSPKTNFDTPKRLKERQLKKKEIKAKKRTIKLVLKAIFCNNISQHQLQSRLNSGSIKALLACERCPLRP